MYCFNYDNHFENEIIYCFNYDNHLFRLDTLGNVALSFIVQVIVSFVVIYENSINKKAL